MASKLSHFYYYSNSLHRGFILTTQNIITNTKGKQRDFHYRTRYDMKNMKLPTLQDIKKRISYIIIFSYQGKTIFLYTDKITDILLVFSFIHNKEFNISPELEDTIIHEVINDFSAIDKSDCKFQDIDIEQAFKHNIKTSSPFYTKIPTLEESIIKDIIKQEFLDEDKKGYWNAKP